MRRQHHSMIASLCLATAVVGSVVVSAWLSAGRYPLAMFVAEWYLGDLWLFVPALLVLASIVSSMLPGGHGIWVVAAILAAGCWAVGGWWIINWDHRIVWCLVADVACALVCLFTNVCWCWRLLKGFDDNRVVAAISGAVLAVWLFGWAMPWAAT